jgi:hypothetical protein
MILHFSHIGLTEGRTFTLESTPKWEDIQNGVLTGALATASGRRYRGEVRPPAHS